MATAVSNLERLLRWASVALFAFVAARPALAHSPALGAAVGCLLALAAAWCAPAGPSGALARAALLVGGALLSWSTPSSLGFDAPWRAFFAQEAGQSTLLLVRGGLYLTLVLASESATSKRRFAALVSASALLFASLVFRGLLLPYCLLVYGLLGWFARGAPVSLPVTERASSLVSLGLAAASLLGPPAARMSPEEPRAARNAVAWWLARKNPYQAHYRALLWAQEEAAAPGEGYLGLARLDLALGRKEAARQVLSRLVAHARSDALREEARRLAASLEAPRQP